jgi:hypothetical protein
MATALSPASATSRPATAVPTRAAFVLIVAAAAVAGLVWTGADATARAVADSGADLTRLLRAMAAIKAAMAVAASAAVLWRFGAPVSASRFGAYALAGAAMAAGPGLIWDMAHVALGAALLHAGLIATVVLVWRDPAVGARLAALVAARRGRRA